MKKCLVALAFGTLGLGMSEFGMMGILTFVASGLHVSIPQAGHLVSAYALGVCIGAPLTVAVAHTRPLKHILLALAGLMVAGNLCAAFAPNYCWRCGSCQGCRTEPISGSGRSLRHG